MATLQEYCNSGLNLNNYISLTYWLGQTFTPAVGHMLNSFKFYMRKASGGTGTIVFKLYATSGGSPTGPVLLQTTYPVASLSTSAAWVIIPMPGFQFAIGVKYFIGVGISSGSGQPAFIYMRNTSGYAGGNMFDSSNGGTSWSSLSNYDLGFEDWGDPSVISTVAASGQTAIAATLNGNLADITNIDQVGFDYGLVSGTYTGEALGSSVGLGAYGLGITGLAAATCYYFRAKAHHTTYGWLYASEMIFQTMGDTTLALYEQLMAGDNAEQMVGAAGQRFCQTFTPAISHQVKSIRLYGRRGGTSGYATISIKATTGGAPSGSDLIAATIDMSVVPASNAWFEVGLGAGITLTAAVKYAIVVQISSSGLYWRYVNANPYAGGGYGSSVSPYTSWAMDTPDFLFQELGESGVLTYPAENIGAFTADGVGYMDDATGITKVGLEWSAGGFPFGGTYPNSVEYTPDSVSAGTFALQMTGLTAIMTYYYRAKVYHSTYGWLYGDQRTFMTTPPTPMLQTDPPSDATEETIDAVGNITSIGAADVDERGFAYGLTSHGMPYYDTGPAASGYDEYVHEEGIYGTGSFTKQLRNLQANKTYYVRAYAHNSYGYSYGGEIMALASVAVNMMYPVGNASIGIRFSTHSGCQYPRAYVEDTSRYMLLQKRDAVYVPATGETGFGYVTGEYIYERQYWNPVANSDLYAMSNPIRRTGTVVKAKWKAHLTNNGYSVGGGYFYRLLSDGSTTNEVYNPAGTLYSENSFGLFYNNPFTGNPWTVEELDTLQMGVKIYSGSGFEIPGCDWLQGYVLWANAAVTTKRPMQLGPTSERLHGLVTEDEAELCKVHFQYGLTTGYGSTTTPQYAAKWQEFYDTVVMVPGNTYHCRAVIVTDCGETFYGADFEYPVGGLLQIAFEQSILTVDPEWTDVSAYCLKLHTKRGRLHELDRCEAGVATFILNNAAGDWWRYNAAGAFYGTAGGVKPLTLVRLRWSFDGYYNIFYGVAESFKPKWLSESGGFTPVMELNCVDVFKSFTRYKIIDANPALIEDATAGEGFAYVDSTRGLVEGQSIRIYEGDKTQTTTILQIVASLNLVIFDDVLAEDYSTNARLKKFPAALSGRRMKDIILEAKWPTALTAIDDGTVTLVELSPKTGGDNLMEAAFKTMEAECGNLFVAADGKVTFHDAVARTKAPYNTSQATFSDDGTHSKYYLPEMSDDDEFIYNECDISGDEIGDQTMLDEDLQLEQGPRSIDKKDSPLADAEDAFDQATISVEKYKLPIPRCVALIVRPDADSEDLWPKVLGYDLGTMITLELNSTMNPACIDVPYHIEGVTCDWEASTDLWETKWQLWDVNKYYMFRCLHEGWLMNVWPEPYEYADIHDDLTAAYVHNDEEAVMQIGQLPYIAFSFNEEILRGQLEFDTTDIDTTWTVANAKIIMMLRPQLSIYDRIAFDLCVVGTYNSNRPLVLADYGNMLGQTTIYGSIEVPEDFREPDPLHPIGVYMLAVIELSAAGIAHINKGGTSRFWLRSKQDIDAVEPTGGNSEHVYIEGHLGDFAPRLLVQVEKEA